MNNKNTETFKMANLTPLFQNNIFWILVVSLILVSSILFFTRVSLMFLVFLVFSITGYFLFKKPLWGLIAMAVLIPSEEILIFEGGRTIIFFLGLATMASWSFNLFINRPKIRFSIYPTALAIIFIIWSVLSVFWAFDQDNSLSRIFILLQQFGLFFLIQNLIDEKRKMSILLNLFFLSTVIFAMVAIYYSNSIEYLRLSLSESQNPAHLAQNLGLGLLLTPYVFKTTKSSLMKMLSLFGFGILIFAILLTGTRAVWVALFIAIGLTSLKPKIKLLKLRWVIALIALLCLTIPLFHNYNILSDYTFERIITLTDIEENRGGSGRTNIWRVGLEMAKDNPIAGVGIGNFPNRFEDYIEASTLEDHYAISRGRDPHNIFLSTLSELGIPGFVIFVALFASIFLAISKYKHDLLSITAIALLLFILTSGFFITIQYRKYFWLVLGIGASVPLIIRKENKKTLYHKNID